jgi:glucose/arabinose dehydrogenase
LAKWGTYGYGEGELKYPQAIAVDSNGNIFVADTGNDRVVVLRSIEGGTNPEPSNGIVINDPTIRAELVADGLFYPTNIAFPSDNDILILGLKNFNGAVLHMRDGEILEEPALRIDLGEDPQGCICGIDASTNANGTTNVFLFFYVKNGSEDYVGIHVNKYDFIDGKLVNPERLFHIPEIGQSIHNGGGLVVGPDKNVYFTIGELDTHRTQAQNVPDGPEPDGSSGIIRITQEGVPAPGNPFSETGLLAYYWAYGIRNGFGIAFDPLTGKAWNTENGPAYGDEINIVEPGFNSGWSRVQGIWAPKLPGENYAGDTVLNPTGLVNFNGKGTYSSPEFTWYLPTAPTGIAFLNSDKLGKQYENDLFVADYNNGYIYRFELNPQRNGLVLDGDLADKLANNISEREQAVFARGFGQITDIRTGPDGYLYVVSLGHGKVYRLVPSNLSPESGLTSNQFMANIEGENIQLKVDSSSKISVFSFDQENKSFTLRLSHATGSQGSSMIYAGSILEGPYTVTIDGDTLTELNLTTDEATGNSILQIEYPPGVHDITVTGTRVVPEFPGHLMALMSATIGGIALMVRIWFGGKTR